jgi:hypothetical protein
MSYARMSPGDPGSVSLTVLPMMSMSSKTTPGVLALTVTPAMVRSSPARMSTAPLSPNVGMGTPVFLSSAQSLFRYVKSTRSPVTTTPRCRKRLTGGLPPFGSNVHRWRPVAASSAMICNFGVSAYSTPSMTMGFACISESFISSCVSYVHATLSCRTFAAVICDSVE